MTIDWTKPIQTRDGRKAEFVRRVGVEYWVVIDDESGKECMVHYPEAGTYFNRNRKECDIVNVPEEEHLCAVFVYPNGHCAFASRSIPGFTGHRTHVVTIKRIGDEVTATVEKV